MAIVGTLLLKLIIPVLLVQLPRLPCFTFTKEPQSLIIVVLGHNTTNVEMKWKFEAEGSSIGSWKIKRFLKKQDDSLSKETSLAYFSSSLQLANRTLYTFGGSVAASGYANFTIKDVLKRLNNADQTKVSSLSGDVYTYRLDVDTAPPSSMVLVTKKSNIVELQVYFPSKIAMLVCQGCQNGSAVENQTITLFCNATGKPLPNIKWMKNGEYYNGSSSVSSSDNALVFQQVAISDTGNYTCIADNGVGNPDRKSLTLFVKYKPKGTLLSPTGNTVCENTTINLSCTAEAYPSVNNYSMYNGNNYLGSSSNGLFSITARSLGRNTFCCVASNEIGSSQCAYYDVYVLAGNINATYKINDKIKTVTTVNEGEKVDLQCDVSGDESYYLFKWFKVNDIPPSHVSDDTRLLKFDSINRADEGYYQVTLRDKLNCSTQTRSFNITVNFMPESTSISISPNQTVFCRGSLVTIFCTSYAKPPAKYSSYLNAKPVGDNGTSGVFNETLNDTGKNNYICVPYNTVGSGQNQSLELQVKEPPKAEDCKVISKNMINGAVVEGERVILMCYISGSDPLNITWTNGSHVWNQVNLTFNSVSRVNDGHYHVTVNNGKECNKADGKNINLTVYFPSSCKINPDVITVKEKENVSLIVTTTGNPPVKDYIWTHPNGSKLTGFTDRRTITVSRHDAGTYKVSVYNGVGDRSNCTGHVAVRYLPEMPDTFNAKPATVCQNKTVTLTCANADAYPPVNNYTLHDASSLVNYSTSGYFEVSAKTIGENTFWCFPWNDVGMGKNTSTKVNVVGPPNIILYKNNTVPLPEPFVLVKGEDANVTFSYSGHLDVTWEKLSGSQTRGQKFNESSIYGYTFSPVNRNHNGAYKLTARDVNGCVTSRRFSLSVHFPPTLALITPSFSVNKSENAIISCNAEGKPEPTLSWTSTTNKTLNTISDGKQLVLNSAGEDDGGNYTCTATNYLGKISNSSVVTIVYKPYAVWISYSREVVLQGSEITINESKTDVNLTCDSNASPSAEYYWIIRTNVTEKVNGKTLIIKKVRPEHAGTYTCTARNYLGSTSLEYELIVNYSPENRTTCYHNPGEIQEGSSVTLICESMSFPNASVSWDQQKNSGEAFQVYSQDNEREFVCTACNSLGCGVCKIKLDVQYGPKDRLNCSNGIRVKEGNGGFWFCKASSVNPLPNYSVFHQNNIISHMSSGYLKNITRKSNGSYIKCHVSNKINNATCATQLIVTFFTGFRCDETKILIPPGSYAEFSNVTVEAYPEPTLFVKSTSEDRINAKFERLSVKDNSIWTYLVKIPARISAPYILHVGNDAGSQSHKHSISNRHTAKYVNASLKIKHKEKKDVPVVRPVMQAFLDETYRCDPDVIKHEIIGFESGSLFMNFRLTVITDMDDYLQPLSTTIREKPSLLKGLAITNIKPGFYQKSPEETNWILIGICIAVAALLIVCIFLILWYRKKKRTNRKNSTLVVNNGAGEIPMHEEPGSRNDGFSPSEYAERGPSHIDPAYDSVDRVQKDAKDKNDNQTQFERVTEESPYAAVDMTKKTKKKNPGELLYADLGDFQKNGDKAPGGRGGIVLEPLPKGRHTKMPNQYEETIYADIVGTKKPASDNQNAEGTSTDVPLDELHGQANETEKPSAETADPSKPNDQKPATGENENPSDVQSVKPLAKEDSEKAFSQTQPADSLHTMNGRNDTTLTTVSL